MSRLFTFLISMFCLLMTVSCGFKTDIQALTTSSNELASTTTKAVVVTPTKEELALFPPDIRKIQERGKLIVAMYGQDRPPFFYKDETGTLVGIDVDLAREIAAKFGVDVEFDRSARNFDEVTNIVAVGKADVAVSKLSITLSRAKKVRFTEPYLVLKQALLVNRVQLATAKLKDVEIAQGINTAQTKLGVKSGTSFIEYAKQMFPYAEILIYDDQNAMMQDVLEGRITAVLYDENETKKFIYENPERSIDIQLVIIPDYEDRLAMAVPPGSEQFLSWLNQYLNTYKSVSNIDQLLKSYIASGGKS